ncbi:24240_t:CDS:2, partial [Dentiscutata erythropus]
MMMKRTFMELKDKEKVIIKKTVQDIQDAVDEDKLKEEYEKAKISELYKQNKNALNKLIPNTIEVDDNDNRVYEDFEIK